MNPKSLVKELAYLKKIMLPLIIYVFQIVPMSSCRIILKLDQLQEDAKGETRLGQRLKELAQPTWIKQHGWESVSLIYWIKKFFAERLQINLEGKNRQFVKMFDSEAIEFDDIFEEYYEYGQQIKQYVTDTSVILNDALDAGKRVLFEGAQGVMLDIDQGTYPFVTSSNPVAGGVTIGSGVGPSKINKVVGVCKAYTSRVGDGPFPTELFDETGETIRRVGKEYGTTTGRPRRVGWFDSVVMRHSKRVSGITNLSLNSIDVLSGLETVKICTAYELDGELIYHYPASLKELSRCKPVYEELPGWSEDITGCKTLADLPANARNYVHRISELVGVRISTFSVGPDRNQTNVLESVWAQI